MVGSSPIGRLSSPSLSCEILHSPQNRQSGNPHNHKRDHLTVLLVVPVECGIVSDPTTVCRRTDAEIWDLVTIPLHTILHSRLDQRQHGRAHYTTHEPVHLTVYLIAADICVDEFPPKWDRSLGVEAAVTQENPRDAIQLVQGEVNSGIVLPACSTGCPCNTYATYGPGFIAGS